MTDIFYKTIRELSNLFQEFLLSEKNSRKDGFLQERNPLLKFFLTIVLILVALFLEEFISLLILFTFSVFLALFSKIDLKKFFSRFIFIPVFSLIIVSPQLFLVPGETVISFLSLSISLEGIIYVTTFFLRVICSVSFISLLIMTTDFNVLISSLRRIGLPNSVASILLITYRYLFLFFKELSSY